MNQKEIIQICKDVGCCDACCLRYIGHKSPKYYKNPNEYILQYLDSKPPDTKEVPVPEEKDSLTTTAEESSKTASTTNNDGGDVKKEQTSNNGTKVEIPGDPPLGDTEPLEGSPRSGSPPHKKVKYEGVCVCCLGILQSDNWPDSVKMVQDVLEKKEYDCATFACALSAPICTLLREKAIALRIAEDVKDYDPRSLTPLKEAWKWSFALQLSRQVQKELDSGAVSPLLVTLNMEYPDDLQELEVLKTVSPALFSERSKQKKRFTVEFTRRSVEQALAGVRHAALQRGGGLRPAAHVARTVSVAAAAQPAYLGGRYIKLSRELPQTPWLVGGERVMDSSVQEIIFEPLARACGIPCGEVEWRLKFIAAGREDVDVRCLGDGRPFAVEISDPRRQLSADELRRVCEDISRDGRVQVAILTPVTREDLTELKKGEETKCKTYEALCIKLAHSEHDEAPPGAPVCVTARDVTLLSSFRNTPPDAPGPVLLTQRTPIRVLHRRPLLNRTRYIYHISAEAVPEHARLVVVRARTQAGTYVKEWVHGDLARSRPALHHAIRAPLDLLALDVTGVHLAWPPTHGTHDTHDTQGATPT